ncbi:MAG TPA: substrate-binding domain-containing protein [Rugosimonospora sp.]|nr:substrate-binding domain-containing protein [Rugosimonospora sp.]
MKTISKAGLGVVGALALITIQVSPAHADVAPQASDVVGVGSDTVQFGMDFLADGDIGGDSGFNTTSTARRVFSFDATGDAAGGATANAQSVLRANSKPIVRPNGSGAGITALLADTGTTEVINFVRSSRLPSTAEQTTATNNGWGGLRVFQFATDGLELAVSAATATNAPTGIPVGELVNIYSGVHTTWSQVPGYTGANGSATIHPYLPQTGSGTRNFFLADLQAANGGTAITIGSNVLSMEEHDPTNIQNDANAIAPFSTGRFAMDQGGYFGAGKQNVVSLLTASGTYNTTRGLYIIVRQRDVTDTTGVGGIPFPFQVGGTKNWVQTLFSGTTSWIARGANGPLIQAAGLVPSYSDLGLAHS